MFLHSHRVSVPKDVGHGSTIVPALLSRTCCAASLEMTEHLRNGAVINVLLQKDAAFILAGFCGDDKGGGG